MFNYSNLFDHAQNNRILIRRNLEEYRSMIPRADPNWPCQVSKVWHCISEAFAESDTNVSEVLDKCGIRSNTIQGQFKWCTGKTIGCIIAHHRIELAKRLLEYEELSINEIAAGVGFSSGESFCRAFKKREGQPPSRYKTKATEAWLN